MVSVKKALSLQNRCIIFIHTLVSHFSVSSSPVSRFFQTTGGDGEQFKKCCVDFKVAEAKHKYIIEKSSVVSGAVYT